MNNPDNPQIDLKSDRLIDTALAAVLLDIPKATLIKHRSTGEVLIPYIKIGRSCRYRTKDLSAWVEDNTINKPGNKSGVKK